MEPEATRCGTACANERSPMEQRGARLNLSFITLGILSSLSSAVMCTWHKCIENKSDTRSQSHCAAALTHQKNAAARHNGACSSARSPFNKEESCWLKAAAAFHHSRQQKHWLSS
jgi:hypothetical protein